MRTFIAIELEEEVHNISHYKTRHHSWHVDYSSYNSSSLEFRIQEQSQGQTDHLLQDRTSEAVDQGISQRGNEYLILEHGHIVLYPDKFFIHRISVPVKKRQINSVA